MRKLLILIFLLFSTTCWADEYYLGQWEWNTCLDKDGNSICHEHWQAPHQEVSTGAIDLRPIDAQAIAGGTPQGYAIFTYSTTVADINMTYLGNGKDDISLTKNIQKIESKLGITPLKSTTPKEIIYELLTDKADPTGTTFAKPLMPTQDMKLDVKIGTEGTIKEVPFVPLVSPESEKIIKVIQNDYVKMAENENPIHVGKWLDSLQEKYKIPYQNFIPQDAEIKLAAIPHSTTQSENFNCADSGSSMTCQLTWTNLANNMGITGNKGYAVTNVSTEWARAESDVSSTDHATTVTIPGEFADTGFGLEYYVFTRYSSSVDTAYAHYASQTNSTNNVCVAKDVTGTFTTLGGGCVSSTLLIANDVLKGDSNGSTITTYINGTSIKSVTDTAITTGTRGGLGGRTDSHNNGGHITATFDNWSIADLGGGGGGATGTIPDQAVIF